MWMDRELAEHQVYDHRPPRLENGGHTNHNGGLTHHASTPTGHSTSGVDTGSSMDLGMDGSSTMHTLPAMDHSLSMDHQDHMDQMAHYSHHYSHPDSVHVGGLVLEHETAMMMQSPSSVNGDSDCRDDVKLPTAKPKDNHLRVYARRFGLNDRGCYLALALAGLAFFFFIIIVAMGATWPHSRLRHSGPLHFCTTPPCLEAAADLLGSQNSSYDPCKDFWGYACGGWLSRQPLPPTRSSWSTLEEIRQAMRVEKSRLITMSAHEPSQFNSVEWKVHNFYTSCMALGFVESDREKPLIKIINALGGWEVLRSFNIYSWDSHRVLQRLHADYFVHAFFRVSVEADAYSDHNIIRIAPDGLGMPHRDYYLNRLPDDPAVLAYQTFMKDSAQLFGASSPEAHKFSVDMFNFEKRLAEITPDFEYLADPLRTQNRMTFKDLHTMSMNIPWLEIVKAAYSEAPMNEETKVVVVSPQYAADIAVILSTTDRASLNNYLMWHLARAYMPYLSKPFRESAELYRKALTGVQKPPERWEFCQATTERFFAHLTSSMVAEQGRLGETERRSVAKKLFDYLKHNIARSISVSSDYDYPSRRAAIAKLKNMTVQVGTPDFLRDRKYLKILYKDLLVQKTDFFQNILYGVIFQRKREEMALISPAEETKWLEALNKDQVNYVVSANKVVVPEAMLQPPLFHQGFPNSANLGGVGVYIAQAMLEGVVGRGLLFEPNGHLRPHNGSLFGVGPSSSFTDPRPLLEMDAQCLLDKFTVNSVDTVEQLHKCRLDSAVTVAAVRQAYVTLEDILELERGILLPAMETMDPQSVFFLAYAQTLCSVETKRQRDIDRTTNNALLAREKLQGVLSQMAEFHHFYYCSYDDDQSCGKII